METNYTLRQLQHASGNFLFEEIPDNWNTLSEEDQLAFVGDHACETFEHHPVEVVWEEIDASARGLARFMNEETMQLILNEIDDITRSMECHKMTKESIETGADCGVCYYCDIRKAIQKSKGL